MTGARERRQAVLLELVRLLHHLGGFKLQTKNRRWKRRRRKDKRMTINQEHKKRNSNKQKHTKKRMFTLARSLARSWAAIDEISRCHSRFSGVEGEAQTKHRQQTVKTQTPRHSPLPFRSQRSGCVCFWSCLEDSTATMNRDKKGTKREHKQTNKQGNKQAKKRATSEVFCATVCLQKLSRTNRTKQAMNRSRQPRATKKEEQEEQEEKEEEEKGVWSVW